MDIYASDEEKGEEIKQWWRDNGRSVILGCVLGGVAIFSGRYWIDLQNTQAANASVAYQQVVKALGDDNETMAEDKTQQLFSEFSGTPYAVFAAFEMAAKSVKDNDTSSAQTYLEWVMTNSDFSAHKELARLRLGHVLLSEEKFEESLALIGGSGDMSFSSLLTELRGDIYVAQGKPEQALTEYKDAILELAQGEPRQQLLQIKLNDVAKSNDS